VRDENLLRDQSAVSTHLRLGTSCAFGGADGVQHGSSDSAPVVDAGKQHIHNNEIIFTTPRLFGGLPLECLHRQSPQTYPAPKQDTHSLSKLTSRLLAVTCTTLICMLHCMHADCADISSLQCFYLEPMTVWPILKTLIANTILFSTHIASTGWELKHKPDLKSLIAVVCS
jgi:hypothetical protein